MLNKDAHYIKLIAAPVTGHKYQIQHYTHSGIPLNISSIDLTELDKLTGKHKMRIKTGKIWGIVMQTGVLAIGEPKFIRDNKEEV